MSQPLFTDGSNSPIANINWGGFKITNISEIDFLGNTSIISTDNTLVFEPVGGGTYTWDAFNHFQLPPASMLMILGSDNNPASSFGKNQIVAGTFSDYTWSRYYSIHAGTRLSVGANSGSTIQTGAALNVQSPSDKTIGTSSINNTTTLVAVGTYFKRDVGIGDRIQLQGLSSTGKVLSIASDTSLLLDTALGDGTSRNIILQLDAVKISSNAGSVVHKIQHDGTITYGDRIIYTPNYNYQLVSANTANNTPTVIYTYNLQPSSCYLFEADVSAITEDQSQRGCFKRMITVYRNGSAAAAIQGVPYHEFSQQSASYSVEWVISGNSVQLQVVGDATLQVNWGSTISFQEFIGG